MALGAAVAEVDIDARTIDVQPGHCASLIYTSGTTGECRDGGRGT